MKKAITVILSFSLLVTFAQNVTKDEFEKVINPLNDKVSSLQLENSRLKKEVKALESNLSRSDTKIEELQKQTAENSIAINKTSKELGLKISSTESNSKQRFSAFEQSLSKKSLLGIIGVLIAILISGAIYWLLSSRQKLDKTDVEMQISKTKAIIEEEQIQVNVKLAELYNGQMELLKLERTDGNNSPKAIDHSLALKVADEIVKMQMNLVHMDSKIKGHRQLSIAVSNVFDNFKANGYEIIDHLNKSFNEGMNLQATMEPDPSMKKGEQIIRRVIKPEIHFNNKVIQHAQVIVAFGE